MTRPEQPSSAPDGRELFLLPVLEDYLLYSPRQSVAAMLNRAAAAELRAWAQGRLRSLCPSLRELAGTLETEPEIPLEHGDRPFDPDFLGLIGSRNCNMDCAYCGFRTGLRAGQRVDPASLTAVIRQFAELKKRLGYTLYKIEFFGGEPFVETELLDIAIHHARLIGAKQGIHPSFRALTNGFLDDRQRELALAYFDHLTVSCDGLPEHHDASRRGPGGETSFPRVQDTLRFLSDRGASFSIRCCVTSASVGSLPQIAAWFCQEFSPATVNFETLTQNPDSQAAGLFPPDPYLFARQCWASWKVLEQKRVEAAYAPVSLDALHGTTCPVGRDTVILHPDGTLASCYLAPEDWINRGMDLSLGRVREDGEVFIDLERAQAIRKLTAEEPRCASCFCKYSCAGNCHVNNSYPGAPDSYSDACLQVRLLTLCRLLQESGYEELADRFVSDTRAARALNEQPSDLLAAKQDA